MKLRVVGHSWDKHAAELVAKMCNSYGIPFIDRAGVAHDVSEFAPVTSIVLEEGVPAELPDTYVYFTHRNIPELPCTHQVQVNYPDDVKAPATAAPAEAAVNSRKITEGSRRLRAEWKELQAKCKSATSFNEWATFLYDLLMTPQFSTAHGSAPDAKGKISYTWQKSLGRASFAYPTNTLDAMPKCVVEDLEMHLAAFRVGNRDPFVLSTEKSLNGRERAVVIDAILIDDTHGDGENDLWLLTIKPTTITKGLY